MTKLKLINESVNIVLAIIYIQVFIAEKTFEDQVKVEYLFDCLDDNMKKLFSK